jgi:hypothetical protein
VSPEVGIFGYLGGADAARFHAFNELNLVLAKVAHSGIDVMWVTKAGGEGSPL